MGNTISSGAGNDTPMYENNENSIRRQASLPAFSAANLTSTNLPNPAGSYTALPSPSLMLHETLSSDFGSPGMNRVPLGYYDSVETASQSSMKSLPKASSVSAFKSMNVTTEEMQRMDLQHNILKFVLRKNCISPVDKPRRILDVGCGTGIWLREIQELFPKSECFGVDIIMYPRAAGPSLRIDYGDVFTALPYRSEFFHFIFQRNFFLLYPTTSWPLAMKELDRVLKPKQLIEFQETNLDFSPEAPFSLLLTRVLEKFLFTRSGVSLKAISRLDLMVQKVLGWKEVKIHRYEVPIGEWAGVSGELMKQVFSGWLKGIGQAIVYDGVTTENEWQKLLSRFWEECERNQTRLNWIVVTARKGIYQ